MSGGLFGGGDTTIRYAPYIENAHKDLLHFDSEWEGELWMGLGNARTGDSPAEVTIDGKIHPASSPYYGYTIQNPADAFTGVGFVITDFPSLFDMYGKFMAGLDIEVLWNQIETDALFGQVTSKIFAAASDELDDEIVRVAYPRMEAGMRDMNAVMTSTFLLNREQIENDKLRALEKLQADMYADVLNLGQQRWAKHLEWNAQVISHYVTIINTYFKLQTDYIGLDTQITTADRLWPFTIMDHKRAVVGALNGAHAAAVKKDSGIQQAIGGALGIAALLTSPAGGSMMKAFGLPQVLSGGGATGAGLQPYNAASSLLGGTMDIPMPLGG